MKQTITIELNEKQQNIFLLDAVFTLQKAEKQTIENFNYWFKIRHDAKNNLFFAKHSLAVLKSHRLAIKILDKMLKN